MSFTILVFVAIVVLNVVSAQKKAKEKERRRKMMQNPTDFTDAESEKQDVQPSDVLRKLLEKYADAHPEDVSARRYAAPEQNAEIPQELTPEQLSDEAYKERLEEERIQALMDYRLERLEAFKKTVGISKAAFEILQNMCLDPEVSDDEFERLLKNAELEHNRKHAVEERKHVPEDCEMQKTLQAKTKELAKNPIRAKAPVLVEESKVVASHENSGSKKKFRMTVAEARRGIVLSKILEEPRYRKRWSPVSR